jgi:hypothetical protein
MPRVPRGPIGPEFPLESLYGGKPASQTAAASGMGQIEKELQRRFDVTAEQEETVKLFDPIAEGVAQVVGPDRITETLSRLSKLDSRQGGLTLDPPALEKVETRISTGSISATVAPPYNYQWTWNAQTGGPSLGVNANRNSGHMDFNIWNNSRSASGSAAAAVGIYFRPMVTNGILRISSNPSFNYNWWTICTLASAHSDGWLGLYVGRYTLDGGFDGAPVSQHVSLWNDDSWWGGAGPHTGSNSGYPLSAQINVDSAHWYAIWAWCGGRATGAGWGTFSGSGAGSNLSVGVPSITWTLF